MGQTLTQVCENPLHLCENPDTDYIEDGRALPLVLRTEDGVVKTLTFSRLDAYKCEALHRRGQIGKLKQMSKRQGRPRQASPGRTTVNMRGEKVYRTARGGGSPRAGRPGFSDSTVAGGKTAFTEAGGATSVGEVCSCRSWSECAGHNTYT